MILAIKISLIRQFSPEMQEGDIVKLAEGNLSRYKVLRKRKDESFIDLLYIGNLNEEKNKLEPLSKYYKKIIHYNVYVGNYEKVNEIWL